MIQEKYGFIYLWYDRKHKRYYLGSHWGTINDGYICSSTWMKQAYRIRLHDFKRRVIQFVNNRQELLNEENKWLRLIKNEELGKRYYNLENRIFGHWTTDKNKLLSIGKKISNSSKGKIPWIKGKHHSEKSRQKIREARAKQIITEKQKQKMSLAHKGKNNSMFGKKHSLKTRQKMSIAQKLRRKK